MNITQLGIIILEITLLDTFRVPKKKAKNIVSHG